MVLIQIALSGGRPRDYEYLAQFMERSGWQSQLAGADNKQHALAPGTYVGSHDDPARLAAELRKEICDSGLDNSPILLTAVIQDWTVLG